jgi:hypothetical protein
MTGKALSPSCDCGIDSISPRSRSYIPRRGAVTGKSSTCCFQNLANATVALEFTLRDAGFRRMRSGPTDNERH